MKENPALVRLVRGEATRRDDLVVTDARSGETYALATLPPGASRRVEIHEDGTYTVFVDWPDALLS